jgi:hypothetical protein
VQIEQASRWKPAVVNGRPVARCVLRSVDFALTQQPLLAP